MFDEDDSFIQNKATGAKTKIYHNNGTYALRVWVLVPEEGGSKKWSDGSKFGFEALAPLEQEESFEPPRFTRLA